MENIPAIAKENVKNVLFIFYFPSHLIGLPVLARASLI